MPVIVNCYKCKKEIIRYPCEMNKTGEYWCSRKCRYPNSGFTEVNCKNCKIIFKKQNCEIEKNPNHFCSKSCSASYNNTHKQHGNRRSKLEIFIEEELRKEYPQLTLFCNDKSTIESELDFYFPDLKFAIELNGITHYEPIYGKDKFEKIQNNDKRKVIACYEKGIELAIVDSSTCTYLNDSAKNKFKKIIFDLLDQVKDRYLARTVIETVSQE